MRPIAIVAAGPEKHAEGLLKVLGEWVSDRLLDPFIWVDPKQLISGPSGTDSWMGVTVGGSGEREEITSLLARTNFEVARLVAIQMMSGDKSDPRMKRVLDALREDVEASLAIPRQRLASINIVVPTSDASDLGDEIVPASWQTNVLVSSEDRKSPIDADSRVKPGRNFTEHSALAAASLGGLWSVMGDGPFDDRSAGQSGEGRFIVTRAFARILRTSALADEVASQMLRDRSGAPWTAVSVGGVSAGSRHGEVVRRLSEEFVKNESLLFSPLPPKPQPKLKRLSYLKLFPKMFEFMVQLGRIQVKALRDLLSVKRLDSLVERLTRIPEEEAHKKLLAKAGQDATSSATNAAVARLEAMGIASSPPSQGSTWETLRSIGYGLVDGSTFPKPIDPPMDGARRLILIDASFVGPNPLAQPQFTEAVPRHEIVAAVTKLRPCDPLQARLIERAFEQEIASIGLVESPPADVGDEEVESSPPETSEPEDPELTEEQEEEAEELRLALSDFRAFILTKSHSFLWRVGVALVSAIDSAEENFQQSRAEALRGISDGQGSAGDVALRKLKSAWKSTGLISLVLLIVAGVVAWPGGWEYNYLFEESLRFYPPSVAGFAVLFLLVTWYFTYVRYERRMEYFRHQQDLAVHRYGCAVEATAHAAQEHLRLVSAYEQYRDWAEIISWMAHRPEGPEPWNVAPPKEAEETVQPLALRVAQAEPSAEALNGAVARCAKKTFSRTWLSGLYELYESRALGKLVSTLGAVEDEVTIDPDRDVHTASSRDFILRHIREGKSAGEWRESVLQTVVRSLREIPVDELFDTVRLADGSAEAQQPQASPRGFFAPLSETSEDARFSATVFSHEARLAGRDMVDRVDMWVVGDDRDIGPGIQVHESDSDERATSFQVARVRVDSSTSCTTDDLCVLSAAAEKKPEKEKGIDIGLG